MSTTITEIAPELFRIATFIPDFNLEFAQFLSRDDEPLLFHTGPRQLFPAVREAVYSLIAPDTLRWVGFSHFESDECGSLNEWLTIAPAAQAVCSLVGALVSVNDVAIRPARPLNDGEVFATGSKRFQFLHTPHVPHCWDAGLMFEETGRTLLCSDLFLQGGEIAHPLTEHDVVDRARQTILEYEASPFANSMPYTAQTESIMQRLAALEPARLATMHGSTFVGDGASAIRALAGVLRDTIGGTPAPR
jgi:flavorubredoxin